KHFKKSPPAEGGDALSFEPQEQTQPSKTFLGLMHPQTAKALLGTDYRQKLLTHIWQRTSVSRQQFEQLYLDPIERYADYAQLFPASESHHHAYAGGMLDHGLEIMAYALKLRQSHLLPVGSAPETQSAQSEAWTAASSYAALLHDIGKIAVDLHIEYEDGSIWHPWQGVLDKPYRFKYKQGRNYHLHGAAAGLLYNRILTPAIMNWLSTYPELWEMFIYFLSGQPEQAGVLGELVMKADQASVAQELGGDPQKVAIAPKNSLQKKLLDGLRYLVKETLKINQSGAGDGWLTEDALWLVSKTVTDKLRAHLLSQGISGIPEKNSILFDVLEEHNIVEAKPQGGAIWTAQVTSHAGWSQSLTLIKLAPALIWGSGERPVAFTGTLEVKNKQDAQLVNENAVAEEVLSTPMPATPEAKHDALGAMLDLLGMDDKTPHHSAGEAFDGGNAIATITDDVVLPENNLTQDKHAKQDKQNKPENVQTVMHTPSPKVCSLKSLSAKEKQEKLLSSELFMIWFWDALIHKKLIMNDSTAVVHTVADTFYLVTPGIFMRYVQEFPEIDAIAKQEVLPGWRWAQKRFERLGVHKKQNNGHNIWTCKAVGPRKSGAKLYGYLLLKPEGMPPILHNNPYLEPVGHVVASIDKMKSK
ncbi:MAG: MobH family relaxase, partial [Saezia sp.]